MHKTISINLSGQVFQIDEHAFEKLKGYLDSIRARFSATQGSDEIIADIESRIAEMFAERIAGKKQVVTLPDVEEMMRLMGKPEEFESRDEAEPASRADGRRMFRNPDDKLLGGVCSGLCAYFGINDPIWLRLLFVISLFLSFGTALFIYLILWILMPEARNASEKLLMRGEPINISNIERTIKDDLNDLGQRIHDLNAKEGAARARNFLQRAVDVVIQLVLFLFKAVVKVAAVLLIIAGVALLAGMIVMFSMSGALEGLPLSLLHPLLFTSKTLLALGVTGFLLSMGIPALLLLFLGFRILMHRSQRRKIRGLGVSLLGLWVTGIILLAFVASKTAADFFSEASVKTELPVVQPAGDTLFVDVQRNADANMEVAFFDEARVILADSALFIGSRLYLNIVKSASGEFELKQEFFASGKNKSSAKKRADDIRYATTQHDSLLRLDEFFTIPRHAQFRAQEVRLTLSVPEGKCVRLSPETAAILHDVKNTQDIHDRNMGGHAWLMTAAGLACLDCRSDISGEGAAAKGSASRAFDFRDFSEVIVSGAYHTEVQQGDEFKIVASGSKRFVENVEVTKKGDALKIEAARGFGFSPKEKGALTITLPEMTRLRITGAGKTQVSGFEQRHMLLDVTGAGSITMKSSVEKLEVQMSGASYVTLNGKGYELKAKLNGASGLKAFGYEAVVCEVDVDGASSAEVNITSELKAEASGSSSIRYKGLPKISSEVSGFSSIKPVQ